MSIKAIDSSAQQIAKLIKKKVAKNIYANRRKKRGWGRDGLHRVGGTCAKKASLDVLLFSIGRKKLGILVSFFFYASTSIVKKL